MPAPVSLVAPAPSHAPTTIPPAALDGPAISEAAPAPLALPEAPGTTPGGRPQWYGERLGKEQRSWLSRTGDVWLYAGNTFPTSFTRKDAAIRHARAMSDGALGAIFVLRAHQAPGGAEHRPAYHLTRSYNAEWQPQQRGLVVDQSHLDGSERLTHLDPDVVAVVDGRGLLLA